MPTPKTMTIELTLLEWSSVVRALSEYILEPVPQFNTSLSEGPSVQQLAYAVSAAEKIKQKCEREIGYVQ